MKTIKNTFCILMLLLLAPLTMAADVPDFIQKTFPEHAISSRMDADNILMGKDAKLAAKTRELIMLGVSAQIPCEYCVYAHSRFAKANGATEAEIKEALAAAAYVRHWSTILNGMEYDVDLFKAEVDKFLAK
ncbi:carboxymuconolactone decarboxylase family protein [Neptuniibacter sp. CAU 1671]|uniref:carboxymuconolactone decarboxylase family protein n=1 Tax=Neptuniibacter sp. CAU 1671 TaxID=3032593 RepID=UPI0023DCCDA4|nr:carboxymuconolactone decarboxylase family protein [Neptuniibacter sp. CAU 1671]MDF2181874.1 carboxymuconolactone decarboxylase family protein [Neptuniibacter sp. CAU 1671]